MAALRQYLKLMPVCRPENPDVFQNHLRRQGVVKKVGKFIHEDHFRLSFFQHRIQMLRIEEQFVREAFIL